MHSQAGDSSAHINVTGDQEGNSALESTLSYGHGNCPKQVIFKEPTRERNFPRGQICEEL